MVSQKAFNKFKTDIAMFATWGTPSLSTQQAPSDFSSF